MKTPGNESSQESRSSSASAEESEKKVQFDSGADPLKQLGEFLRKEKAGTADDAEEPDDGDDGDEPPQRKSKSKPKKLEQLAEALGLEEADIYAIEVPPKQKGAEALSFGKLKDLAAEHGDFTIAKLKLDQDRRAFEAQRVAQDQEFHELMAALPPDAIKPEAMQKLRGILEKRRAEQRELTLEQIPEWADEAVRGNELKAMLKHLEGYAVSPAFLVANVSAGLMRFVRDAWKDRTSILKALEQVQERKPKTPGRARTDAGTGGGDHKRANGGPMTRTQRQVGSFMGIISNHGKR